MKIKIIADALGLHRSMVNLGQASNSDTWEAILKAIAGKVLVVETDFIFATSFNTAPIPGVSETGIKIGWRFVDGQVMYEGDGRLEAIQRAMQSGLLQCRSFDNTKGEFVDLQDAKSRELAERILKATDKAELEAIALSFQYRQPVAVYNVTLADGSAGQPVYRFERKPAAFKDGEISYAPAYLIDKGQRIAI